MVKLYNLDVVASKFDKGRFTGEEVIQRFRYFYGDDFTSHDLNKACRLLGWRINKRSGKSDYIYIS